MSAEGDSGNTRLRSALETTLKKRTKKDPFSRSVSAATRGLALGHNRTAVRDALRGVSDLEVAESAQDMGVWSLIVDRAESYLALKVAGGEKTLLERNAMRLAANVLSGERKGLAGAGQKEREDREITTDLSVSGDEISGESEVSDQVEGRAFYAIAGKDVLLRLMSSDRAQANRTREVAVVSREKWEQEYASSVRVIRKALAWGEHQEMLERFLETRSGASTYKLASVRDQEQSRVYVDVAERLIGLAGSVPLDGIRQRTFVTRLDAYAADDDDSLSRDVAARRQARREAAGLVGSASNPLSAMLANTWTPTGLMAGLDSTVAAKAVAEIIWSVDSVVWRSGFAKGTLPERLTWADWLGLLAGAAGLDGASVGVPGIVLTRKRALRVFVGLVERLNGGESFSDIVREHESEWALAKRADRMAKWKARSEAKMRELTAFRNRAVLAADDAEFVLDSVGVPVPKGDAEPEVTAAWMKATYGVFWAMEPDTETRKLVAKNFGVRLRARHHEPEAVSGIVSRIFGEGLAA